MRPTDAEEAELDPLEPADLDGEPVAMVPVRQLYRRDTPGFICPPDADLLQVAWCPLLLPPGRDRGAAARMVLPGRP
jgi:hypothetical protein